MPHTHCFSLRSLGPVKLRATTFLCQLTIRARSGGYASAFPRISPRWVEVTVEPSPWLVWPHAMEVGLCLHGFQERPVMGTPEYVVSDSLARLAKIVNLSRMGSCAATRDAEFRREITSYWSRQQGQSLQNLILLIALKLPRSCMPLAILDNVTIWPGNSLARPGFGIPEKTLPANDWPISKDASTGGPRFLRKASELSDLRLPAPSYCSHGFCRILLLMTERSWWLGSMSVAHCPTAGSLCYPGMPAPQSTA
jgi:hypothetical protein